MAKTGNNSFLMAIVQSQDVDAAEEALRAISIDYYRLPSVGGFLGRRNATIIIKTPPDSQEQVIEILRKNCRQRFEYIAVPLESASLTLPTPTPISVGGAIIFGIEADYYEEL